MKWIEILRVNRRAQNRIHMESLVRRKWGVPELTYKGASRIKTPQCQLKAASKGTWA